ncbi:hypothetical protein [Mangrovicoccus ximenensis]|uniref:hypothetical protein n=1 Tax=Mangrovicoccus ximenensis TaxID=1911570 RepID=UPI000D37A1F1|nr:hypothetical protein [Mangrovicoccus ximenensis]
MTQPFRPARRRLLVSLAAFPVLGIAAGARAEPVPERTVASAAELEEAFRSAPDGSRLLLAPGQYGHVRLADRSFSRGMVLTSADPARRAVFARNLHLDGVGNMAITGVDFATAGFVEHRGRMDKVQLGLTGCRDLVVSDAAFTGYIPAAGEGVDPEAPDLERHFALDGYARDVGIAVRDCTDVLAAGLRMTDLRIAVACEGSDRVRLLGIEVDRALPRVSPAPPDRWRPPPS